MKRLKLTVLLAVPLSLMGQGPSPVITRVANAASLAPSPYDAIAPSSLITIFGRNLAPSPATAPASEWPESLNGVRVRIRGKLARLQYVSPGQINMQAPPDLLNSSETRGSGTAIVETESGGTSEPFAVGISSASLGVFTQNGSGCGPGAILNRAVDGSVQLNTPDTPVEPGGVISVYLTGLGPPFADPPAGVPAPPTGRLLQVNGGWSTFGLFRIPTTIPEIYYAGRAPGFVRLDQVDTHVPDGTPEGCAIPLEVGGFQSYSQPVTLSVRRGPGPCVESPPARSGEVRIQTVTTSGPGVGPPVVASTVDASFTQAPGNLLVPPPAPPARTPGICSCGGGGERFGPDCPVPGVSRVGAGGITISTGAGGPFSPGLFLSPLRGPDGGITYDTKTFPSVLGAGRIAVVASGDAVGSFFASFEHPALVTPQTVLPPDTRIPRNRPFRFAWAGGSPNVNVRMRLISETSNPRSYIVCDCFARGDAGFVEVPTFPLTANGMRIDVLPQLLSGPARVEFEVTPVQQPTTNATDRVSLTWSQKWFYYGLRLQ